MSVTLKLFFDDRRPLKKKKGEFPYKLRVTFQRQSLEFQTIYSLSAEDDKKLAARRLGEELQEFKKKINKCLSDAQAYVDDQTEFSWTRFIRDFINHHSSFQKRKLKEEVSTEGRGDFDFGPYESRFKSIFEEKHPSRQHISYVFCLYIKKLIRRRKIGSALNYQYAYNSLKKFGGNVTFQQITDDWLFEYEAWMTTEMENSLTTVGIVLRPLRCIFNEAASAPLNLIDKRTCYPFGTRRYQIPSSRNVKKAFSAGELRTLYDHDHEDSEVAQGMDYWWFLYFGNGMNMKDAALLRYSNWQGDFISFRRAKTDRTTRQTTLPISAYVNEDMRRIIDRRGNPNGSKDDYIFPILKPGMNPLEQHDAIKAFIRFVNRCARSVCAEVGLSKEATTKVTRLRQEPQLFECPYLILFVPPANVHQMRRRVLEFNSRGLIDKIQYQSEICILGLAGTFLRPMQVGNYLSIEIEGVHIWRKLIG
jgi:integrase/recombinase XerD